VVNLAGTASDSDGNIATYSWEQIGGAGVALSGANTADASFTAPAVSSSAVLEFRLEVTDDAGASASDTVKVTVSDISKDSTADVDAFIAAIDARFASETWALGSEQDTAQAQASASGTYLSGGYLSAARNRFISHLYSYFNFFFEEAMRRTENGLYFSYDFMNSEANWQRDQWRAYLDQFLGAYFGGHNSNDVDRIIKNDVLAAIDDAIINALNRLDAEGRIADAPQPENKAPTANAGSDQTVSVGTTVSLSGSGTDPDGFIASVRWQQESGTSVTITDADMEFASFVAPTIEGSEELVFRFVVTDNDGAYASDTVTITVSDEPVSTVNELPTAEAGTNRTVDEGAAVDLTGLGTDSDGTIVSYAWQQVSGTVVTIFNSDTANASFTAPEVSATEKLEFRFTVTDNDGATASDLVTITVIDVPAIAITVEEPRADAIVGAELNVTAIVNSTLEVAEVRATVSDRQSQLFYSADTGRFEGILSLEGLARGAHTLEVVAKDVVGEEAREVRGIVFDKKPELTVLAPLDNTTAIPLLRVTASCVDDDPIGCEIIVYATEASNDELFSGQNSIDSEIDLSAYAGSALTIRITAIDSAGQVTELSRRIYVEVATALSEIFAVSGLILDVQDSKILHQIAEDSGDRLEVIDWRNGTTNSVPLPAGKRVSSKHFLTPFGAIFVTQDVGGSVLSSRVYDWNQGVIDDLGFPNSANSLAAEGWLAAQILLSALRRAIGEMMWQRTARWRTGRQSSILNRRSSFTRMA
jgi:hypothetical protein